MSIRSTVPSAPYSSTNTVRLMTSSVVLTDGDKPFFVSMIPCTIHGCRPLSVSSQPAVLMTNGSTAIQVAVRRNRPDVASFLRRFSQSPHSATSTTMTAR